MDFKSYFVFDCQKNIGRSFAQLGNFRTIMQMQLRLLHSKRLETAAIRGTQHNLKQFVAMLHHVGPTSFCN